MHHGFTRALAAFLFLAFAVACANEMTAEQARSKIDALGVPFDEEGIVGAIGSGDNELLRLFLLAGFDPDRRQESAPAPLELAAARANLPALRMLIEAGASAAELPGILNVPAARDDVTALELLLDAGADIESEDHLRQTALGAAASRGRTLATQLLLERGASPDGRTGRGERPLLIAIKIDSRELLEMLVDAGANVELVGGAPIASPLIVAAGRGQAGTVDYLLAQGAEPARAIGGMTAARAARRSGHEGLAERLEQAAAN